MERTGNLNARRQSEGGTLTSGGYIILHFDILSSAGHTSSLRQAT